MSKIQVFDLMMPEDEEKFLKGGDLVVIKVSELRELIKDMIIREPMSTFADTLLAALDGKEGE